jgi:hypothetical protein
MKNIRPITPLVLLIAVLALAAAAAGVFGQGTGTSYPFTTLRGETVQVYGHGLYRYDTVSYAAQAVAQDAVTLVLGLPLLIVGLVLARRNLLRGQLLLTGTLGYFLYTYTSMVFLAAYNPLFLAYVALFSLSLFAFILALSGLDPEMVTRHIAPGFPRRALAVFLAVIAAFLTLAWLGRIVPPLVAGTPPFGLEAYTTLVIQAMDLGLIVPVSALTAVLLWQKRRWGATLAAVVTIKGLTMGAALVAMIVSQVLAGVQVSMIETVMFSGIALAALIFTVLLFRNVSEPVQAGNNRR